jgi:arylsulfatase A-like enzyme
VLGKLLDAIDSIDPDTYVIFIGDNGTPMYGRPGLDFIDNMYITRSGRGKGTVYESGALVPMFVTGPEIEAGSVSHEFAHAVDVYSTALALAGLEVPEMVSDSTGDGHLPLAGVSLAPILFEGARAVRDPNRGFILTETHDLMRDGIREVGARNGSHKVLCTDAVTAGSCEFFDLISDPLEEYPLAKPESCAGFESGSTADPAWHFCRLTDVIAGHSFL